MKITVEGIPRTEKGAPLGVCPLDAAGKVDTSFLPASVVGAMEFKGPWDASGGLLPTPVGLELGWYYLISVAGTLPIGEAEVGDMLVCEDPVAPTWTLYQGNMTIGDLTGEVQANGANLVASRIVETDGAKKFITAAKATAYNKNFGAATGNVPQIAAAGLGNSQTAETDGTGKLVTAAKGTAYNKNFGSAPGSVPGIGSLSASQIVETSGAKLLITAAKATAYNKNFGTAGGNVPEIAATGLGNTQTVETNASGKLISAAKQASYNKPFGTSAGTVCEGNDSRFTQVLEPDVSLTGAAPVDADVATWSNGDKGIGIGTGGRIFLMYKYSGAVKYSEMS